jgi:hypothetical protein
MLRSEGRLYLWRILVSGDSTRVRKAQDNNLLNQTKDTEIKWTIDAASTQARPKWGNTKLMNGFAGSGKGRWDFV